MFDQELLIGGLLNRARNALSMLGPKNQRAQNQQIQGSLQSLQPVFSLWGRHLTCE